MSQPVSDTIVIHDLRVKTMIGVEPEEHLQSQTVRFDIEIEAAAGYASDAARTDDYLSYADIVQFIEAKAGSGEHVRLVEEWAESIADFALAHPLAVSVMVRVLKTEIFESAGGVGIRITRRRT